MKKQYLKTMATLFVAAFLLLTGCGANNARNNSADNNVSGQENALTEADARQIALQKAGLETATFTKQEYDANESEFEFEFHTDDKEYDCDVNATDGTINNYSVENREFLD